MEDQEVRLQELQAEYNSINDLLSSGGWKELMEIAEDQLKLRMPGVLSKLENILELPAQEFEKGEISGIELFCALPGIRREALEQDIQLIEEELNYGREERTTTDRDERDSRDPDGAFEPPSPGV